MSPDLLIFSWYVCRCFPSSCLPGRLHWPWAVEGFPWLWGYQEVQFVPVCPMQLSHDGNETLPLHLYVKSADKNIDSKLQGGWPLGKVGEGPNRRTANCVFSSTVTLYNCSFGRSDCSLCLAADPAYRCVWCRGSNRCVYAALCSNVTSECPPPVITRVSLVAA